MANLPRDISWYFPPARTTEPVRKQFAIAARGVARGYAASVLRDRVRFGTIVDDSFVAMTAWMTLDEASSWLDQQPPGGRS